MGMIWIHLPSLSNVADWDLRKKVWMELTRKIPYGQPMIRKNS